jgi:hypothetical protein
VQNEVLTKIEVKRLGFWREQEPFTRREWGILAGFILFAFVIRLYILRFHPPITGDGVWYATLGKNLISGNFKEGLSTYWPPLYPLLVGISSLLVNDLEYAGRFVSVLAGSLLVFPVYLLSRSIYSTRVAFLAVLLTVIHPILLAYSTYLLTESTYTLALITAIAVGWLAISTEKKILFFLTGLAIGACYLLRPEAIGYVILVPISYCIAGLVYKEFQLKAASLNTLLLLAGFLLLALPYLLYLHEEMGRWTISGKLSVSLQTTDRNGKGGSRALIEGGTTTIADKYWAGSRSEADAANPTASVSTPASNSRGSISPSMDRLKYEISLLPKVLAPLLIVLSLLGLLRTRWSRKRFVKESYLLAFLLSTLVGYSCTPVFEERYYIPFLPVFFCWSAKGALELESWLADSVKSILGSKTFPSKGRVVIRGLIITSLVLFCLRGTASLLKPYPWDPKPVAMWIKGQADSKPVIMATDPWPAFYTGGKHIYIPNEEYSVIIDYARKKKIDYIVVQEDSISATPSLGFLLNEESQHPELMLAYQDDRVPKRKILIFKLL